MQVKCRWMLQDINWSLKTSKMFIRTLQRHCKSWRCHSCFAGNKNSKVHETAYLWRQRYLRLIIFEDKGTWDCLLWRQRYMRLVTFEDKYTWHWLLLKTKVPETAYFEDKNTWHWLLLKTNIFDNNYFWRQR